MQAGGLYGGQPSGLPATLAAGGAGDYAVPFTGKRRRTRAPSAASLPSLTGAPQRTGAAAITSGWKPGEAGRFSRYRQQGLSTDEAMSEERLRRATQESFARIAGRRTARELFAGQAPFSGGGAGAPAALSATPAARPTAASIIRSGGRAPAMEGTVGGLGRYSRPLAPGYGRGEGLQEQAEETAANQRLAEAMQEGAPMATTRPTKHFTPSALGQAPLQDYTSQMIAYREALAAGETPEYPGAYQASPGETGGMTALEAMRSRKPREGLDLPSKSIRQRMVTARAQGRPMGPEEAQIAQKIFKGEDLGRDERQAAFGPPTEFDPGVMERQAEMRREQIEGDMVSSMAAAGVPPSNIRKFMLQRRRGELAASGGEGGGAPPGSVGETAPIYQRVYEQMDALDLGEDFTEAFKTGDTDQLAAIMRAAGVSSEDATEILQIVSGSPSATPQKPGGSILRDWTGTTPRSTYGHDVAAPPVFREEGEPKTPQGFYPEYPTKPRFSTFRKRKGVTFLPTS